MINEEVSIKLLGRLTLELELDMNIQLNVKSIIDEVLYEYEIGSKCTALTTSDINEKARMYLACKKLDGLAEGTLYNYALFLNKMDEFFNKQIASITTMDLRMFLTFLNEGKSASTQDLYVTKLKTFFSWLQNEEYITINPAVKLQKVKVPKIRKEPYRSEDIEYLRDACETIRDKAMFELMSSSACRVGEITKLKLGDINLHNRTMKVLGKGNKERLAYFSTRAAIYLEEYINNNRKGESEFLFTAYKKPYNALSTRGIQKFVERLKKKSGVVGKVHTHRFRRTQATSLLNSGMSLAGVQEILGHESPETTQRYARLTQDNLGNEFKRLIK
ncbi:MAG: tyrosine-type recombinase/integrase [Sarcina sp.]